MVEYISTTVDFLAKNTKGDILYTSNCYRGNRPERVYGKQPYNVEPRNIPYNAAELKKIKALIHPETTFSLVRDKQGSSSTITQKQFFEDKRTDIINSFNAVKKDFADLIKQMINQKPEGSK